MNQKRAFLYGARATALTLIVVLAVILLNGLTAYLTKTFPGAKIDLTPQRYYTVSKEAKAYFKSVEQPVKLISLTCIAPAEIQTSMQQISDTVARFASQNDNIVHEVFDLDASQEGTNAFIEKYVSSSDVEMTVFSVVVETMDGASFQVVTPALYEVGFNLYPSYTDFESRIANGIEKLLKGEGAEEISIPEKPSFNPSLYIGVDPNTKQMDEELLTTQLKTMETIFVYVFPAVLFIVCLIVFIVKRKK